MAEKKATTKKATGKAAPKKATRAAKKVTSGVSYECELCGLSVTVDEECGCVDVCDIICCGEQMKEKAS